MGYPLWDHRIKERGGDWGLEVALIGVGGKTDIDGGPEGVVGEAVTMEVGQRDSH